MNAAQLDDLVYLRLASTRGDDSAGWQSYDMVAHTLGRPDDEVRRSLRRLKRRGLVAVTTVRGDRRWHRLDDCDPWLCQHVDKED